MAEKKVYDIKSGVKDKLRPILFTGVMLAVTVLAGAASFIAGMGGDATAKDLPIFLGGLAVLCWLGLTLLAITKRDAMQSKVMVIIFGVSFIAFIGFLTASIHQNELSQVMASILALPYLAVYPLFTALGLSPAAVMTLVYAALIGFNAWNWFRLSFKKKPIQKT